MYVNIAYIKARIPGGFELGKYTLLTSTEVYERVRHAPDRIRQHADYIKCFLDIAHHIQEKHSSDSSILLSQLKLIISQACNLRDLIDRAFGQYTHSSFRRRYWKLLKGNKEKRILAALQSLEREKTGLSLCLAASHTEILNDVRREIRMSETDMTDYKSSGQDSAKEHDPSSALTSDYDQENKSEEVKLGESEFEKIRDEKISGATAHTASRKALRHPRPNTAIGGHEKGKNVPSTDKKTIQNVDTVCEAGYENIGVVGEGVMAADINNYRAKCTKSGNLNCGIILPGGGGSLFFPDNSK